MTLAQLIAQLRGQMATLLAQRNTHSGTLAELRSAETTDQARVDEVLAQRAALDAELDTLQARVADLEAEQARDDAMDRLSTQITPAAPGVDSRAATVRVGAEPRTYRSDNDPKGKLFLADVAGSFLSPHPEASARLARHQAEERAERGDQLEARAAGTSAFQGLVVPQYLVDQFAPFARAGRPFADACRHHDLPETGMTATIGALTTGTSVDEQGVENSAVSETDADDTVITVNLLTNAGQQTLSRQAVERGVGVDDTTAEDLFAAYATTLDGKLLNRAVTGLSAVATAISYTDVTPTGGELYPKLLQAPAQVEAALLNQQTAMDTIAVMHSRRWYWLQSQLSSTWPTFGQPGVGAQQVGINFGEKYGSGFRGVLPSGVPVIVDNNIATNKGAGNNEDEIFFGSTSEFHLWEDPSAPMFIRAEQAKAASLGILLVVYGYYAFLATRRAHAQKVGGTGLVTPAWV